MVNQKNWELKLGVEHRIMVAKLPQLRESKAEPHSFILLDLRLRVSGKMNDHIIFERLDGEVYQVALVPEFLQLVHNVRVRG